MSCGSATADASLPQLRSAPTRACAVAHTLFTQEISRSSNWQGHHACYANISVRVLRGGVFFPGAKESTIESLAATASRSV